MSDASEVGALVIAWKFDMTKSTDGCFLVFSPTYSSGTYEFCEPADAHLRDDPRHDLGPDLVVHPARVEPPGLPEVPLQQDVALGR